MFFRPKSRPARFATWAFADLLVLFSILSLYRPAVGLAGLGAVLILISILVEANRQQIWEGYKKAYKKSQNPFTRTFHQPREVYNQLNIYLVWPVVFLLGLAAIYAAFQVG